MNTKAEVEAEVALLVVGIVSSVTNLDTGLESAPMRTQALSEAEVEEEAEANAKGRGRGKGSRDFLNTF